MQPNRMGAYFDEFTAGELIDHALSKTVMESDNNLFSLLTMNHHPVHLDATYAGETQHGRILVVGTYVLSLVVGFTVSDISGKAIANLGYDEVRHLGPVFVGDTLRARTVVLSAYASITKTDRGIVEVETTGINQHGTEVLKFKRKVLIQKKPQ